MTPDVIDILSNITRRPPSAFSAHSPFELDSLDRWELALAVEDRWRLEIPEHVSERWRTPADVVRYLETRT